MEQISKSSNDDIYTETSGEDVYTPTRLTIEQLINGISSHIYTLNKRGNEIKAIEYLQESIEKFNIRDYQLNKLLLQASSVKWFNLKMIKLIVDIGADTRINSDECFVNSCLNNNPDIVQFFLDAGANVNAHNGQALINVIYCNCKEVAKILFENNIIVTEEALQEAIRQNSVEIIELILERDMDPNMILKMFLENLICIRGTKSIGKIFKLLNQTDPDYYKVINELDLENAMDNN
jgi:hypothetical protein